MRDAAVVTDSVEISSGFYVFLGHGFVGADFADVYKFRVRCPMADFAWFVYFLFQLRFHEDRVSSRCFGPWIRWSVELLRWHSQTGEF
jgi:hypothetical protein